jgi:TolA-binding protein
MAQQHGTTLEQALINYTSMEQKLRADVVGGLDVIVNNLNLKAPNGAKLGLRDIAYHVLSQSPEQLQQVQMGNAQQAQTSQIGALHQEVRGLKDQLAQMHTAQQFTYTRSQVDQFADSHPRFDELGTEIENELKLGFDLESAYRRAELLKPASTAAQTRTTAPQTRAPADRSISGSPGGTGANSPATRSSGKTVGRREAIANAIKRVNGGL